jgi:hypothetical protein
MDEQTPLSTFLSVGDTEIYDFILRVLDNITKYVDRDSFPVLLTHTINACTKCSTRIQNEFVVAMADAGGTSDDISPLHVTPASLLQPAVSFENSIYAFIKRDYDMRVEIDLHGLQESLLRHISSLPRLSNVRDTIRQTFEFEQPLPNKVELALDGADSKEVALPSAFCEPLPGDKNAQFIGQYEHYSEEDTSMMLEELRRVAQFVTGENGDAKKGEEWPSESQMVVMVMTIEEFVNSLGFPQMEMNGARFVLESQMAHLQSLQSFFSKKQRNREWADRSGCAIMLLSSQYACYSSCLYMCVYTGTFHVRLRCH